MAQSSAFDLAKQLTEMNRLDQSYYLLDSLERTNITKKDSFKLAFEFLRLGSYFQNYNDYSNAFKSTSRSSALFWKIKDTSLFAYSMISQAHFLSYLNRYSECIELFYKIIGLCEDVPFDIKMQYVKHCAMDHLGDVYYRLGDIDRSLILLEQSKDFFFNGKFFFDLTSVYYSLAVLYKELNNFYLSEMYLSKIVELAPQINQTNDRLKSAYSELSDLYKKQGHLNTAIEYKLKAINLLKSEKAEKELLFSELGDLYLKYNNLQLSEKAYRIALMESPNTWHAMSGLAQLFEYRNLIKQADSLYLKATEICENRFRNTKGSTVVAISRKLLPFYKNAARFYWRIGKPDQSFELLEKGRARYLSQLLNLANIKTKKSAYSDSLKNIENKIGELYRKSDTGLNTNQLQILVLEAVREQLLDSIKKYAPDLYTFEKNKIPSLTELQQKLGSEFQLIEYAVMDDSVFGLAINSKKVMGHVLLIPRDSLKQKIDKILTAKQPSLEDMQDLYFLLIKPFEDNLQPGKTLIIIPDDALFRLPFEMLVKSHEGNYRSANYLLHDYPVSYAISASIWLDRLDRYSRAPKNYAGFASTTFDTLSALPAVRKQVDDAADQFFLSSSWTDQKETRQLFVNRARQYKILDLATHAFVSDIEPMRSKIVFKEQDGEMNAFEIYELELDADLAVLSACGTGLGKLSAGEGFMGFNQAFSYAGVYSLILSMWNIDDDATQVILKSFYEKLAEGLPRARAMQEAKLEYLANGYELKLSPRYWAGLTLWGNPKPVALAERPYELWIISFCVMILVIIGFRWNKRKNR